jgi:hypothetical protein
MTPVNRKSAWKNIVRGMKKMVGLEPKIAMFFVGCDGSDSGRGFIGGIVR